MYSVHNNQIEKGLARNGEGETTIVYLNACIAHIHIFIHTHTHKHDYTSDQKTLKNRVQSCFVWCCPDFLNLFPNFFVRPQRKFAFGMFIYFHRCCCTHFAASFVNRRHRPLNTFPPLLFLLHVPVAFTFRL